LSTISATFRGKALVQAGTSPVITNVAIVAANTEVSHSLGASTKSFLIRVRGLARLQLSYTSGDSGTTFVTVPKGCNYSEGGIDFSGVLYFQTDKPTQTVEILEWQ
jgi:hypothetical protein